MNKYEIADKLEKSILYRVNELLETLPNYITIENEDTFVSVCDKIENITVDAFDEAKALAWLGNGAKPSDTVRNLFSEQGIMEKFHNSKIGK